MELRQKSTKANKDDAPFFLNFPTRCHLTMINAEYLFIFLFCE